jgi:hypothetical protein
VFFINADAADNYGVELELRKGLGFLASSLQQVVAFTNVTVMESQIHPARQRPARPTRTAEWLVRHRT